MDVNAEQAFKDSLSNEAKYTLESSRALYERERILHMETKVQLETLMKERAELRGAVESKFSDLLDDVKGEEIVGGKKLWREHLNLRILQSKTKQQLQESHRTINNYMSINTSLQMEMEKLQLEKRQKLTAFSNKITEVEQTLLAKHKNEVAQLKKQVADAKHEVKILKDEAKETQTQYSKETEEKAALLLKFEKVQSELQKVIDTKQRYLLKSKRYYDLYIEEQKKVEQCSEYSTWQRQQEDLRRKITVLGSSMDELKERNRDLAEKNRYLSQLNQHLEDDAKCSADLMDDIKKNHEREIIELKTKIRPQAKSGQNSRDPPPGHSSWTHSQSDNRRCFNSGCHSGQHYCHNRLPERGSGRFPVYRRPSRFRPKGGQRYTPVRSQQQNGRHTTSPRQYSSDRRSFNGPSGPRQEAPMRDTWYQPPRAGDRKYVNNNPRKGDLNKLEGIDKYQN